MGEKRIGSQEPTVRYTLPYTDTKGIEAVDIYEKSGRVAMEWQRILSYDMMATNESGEWLHPTFGYAVPRQNGKNEIITIREVWGLFHGEKILHTAHLTATSAATWKRILAILEAMGCKEAKSNGSGDFRAGKSKGRENIIMDKKHGGGFIEFRTRSATGALGESFDLLVIDEAQEYREEHQSAMQYTISASANPQTVLLGTPPTMYSSGTLFQAIRQDTLSGKRDETGWAEWSVDGDCDINDQELWYKTNPSLGQRLKLRTIMNEDKNNIIDFQIQRLGRWVTYNQKSEISENDWLRGQVDTMPKLEGDMCIGIKYGKESGNVALTVAIRTEDGKTFTETQGCRPAREGNAWIIDFIRKTKNDTCKVIIDGNGGKTNLEQELKEAKQLPPYLPTVSDVITAFGTFEQELTANNLVHMSQPAVMDIVTNVEKRAITSSGGWGYKSIKEGADVAILDSIVLARWGLANFKKKRQKAFY